MKSGILVGDAMTTRPVICPPEKPLKECAKEMAKKNVGSLLVVDGDDLVGIVTEEDFVRKAAAQGIDVNKATAADIMTTDLITISPSEDIVDAIKKMSQFKIRHLPVVENDRVVGYLTLRTIIKLEPQLIDLMTEKIELRGISPQSSLSKILGEEFEGICSSCGNYSTQLIEKDGELLCPNCLE